MTTLLAYDPLPALWRHLRSLIEMIGSLLQDATMASRKQRKLLVDWIEQAEAVMRKLLLIEVSALNIVLRIAQKASAQTGGPHASLQDRRTEARNI